MKKTTNPNENNTLSVNAKFWRDAGIVMPEGHKAAEIARQSLHDAGAHYVPGGDSADTLVIAANIVSESVRTEANARRTAAITLAWIDRNEVYKTAIAANGKPYTSTLAMARDLLPGLEKSTVANLIGAGRDVYTPAIEGKFTAAQNKALLDLNPSVAVRIKSAMGDKATAEERAGVLKGIMDVRKQGRAPSKKDADEIVKNIKNPSGYDDKPHRKRNMSRRELKDSYTAKLRAIIPTSNVHFGDNGLSVLIPKDQVNVLKTMLTIASTAENNDVPYALVECLKVALFGEG